MCAPMVVEVLGSQSFSCEIHHFCIQQRDDVTSVQCLSICNAASFFLIYFNLQTGKVIDTVEVTEF